MARKVIRRRRPQYETAKAWLCRGWAGSVTVWLSERNEIRYNGVWWETVSFKKKSAWLTTGKNTWHAKSSWSEADFAELFDISIDELPALGECYRVTIEIEKED